MADRDRKAAEIVAAAFAFILIASLLAGCGAEKVAVPGLAGLGIAEAEAALRDVGLEPGGRVEEFSDTVPKGAVIESEPAGGAMVGKGSAVSLTVSRGPEKVEVPAVLGRPEPDAVSVLQGLGFGVRLTRAYSEDVPSGHVCAVDPAPGTAAANGCTVTLTISDGSAYVACPRCGGSGRATSSSTCPRCGGAGTAAVQETCHECGGSGVCYT